VLYVQDQVADARLVEDVLRSEEHSDVALQVAFSGEDALAVLHEWPEPDKPNLILLGWHIQPMSGRQFLQIVKADEVLRTIPVVVLAKVLSQHENDQMEPEHLILPILLHRKTLPGCSINHLVTR
jgi:CheY-like chemotaxis protein